MNDQTDGTKHVHDLGVKIRRRKSQEGQADYCNVLKKSMYEGEKQKAGMNEWVLVGDLLTYLNLTAHINTEHKQAVYQLSNDLSKMLIDGGNSKF